MALTLLGMATDVSAVPENALSPMLSSPSGSSTEARLEHERNASSPILVSDLCSTTLVRLVSLANAPLPIPLTGLRTVREDNDDQPAKA